MRPPNKRKKRTRAEMRARRQREHRELPRFFMAVTEEQFADRWSAATWQAIIALCGTHVDGEEICSLAEAVVMQNIDPDDRPVFEALAAAINRPRTPLPYRPQLIDAAMLAAADPVFIAANGPDALWRKEAFEDEEKQI